MIGMSGPTLSFTHGFDERVAFEAELKGYYANAVVQLPTGKSFKVCFYDPVRLAQDLERGQESGEVCIAEPGLIVVPRVTLHYMERAVARLFKEGYFEYLTPLL
jgi:hypothetical protein